MIPAFIESFGSYVPSARTSNQDICNFFGFPQEKGERYGQLLGVQERPLCVDYFHSGKQLMSSAELAANAIKDCAERGGFNLSEVDTLICCSATTDYIMPSISSLVLKRLGLDRIRTFDLVGGCAEFVHGIFVASALVSSGQAKNVMVTSSEVMNAWWKQVRYPIELFVFGDCGGACLVTNKEKNRRIVDSFVQTAASFEGKPVDLICLPLVGGKAEPPLFYDQQEYSSDLDDSVFDIDAPFKLIHDSRTISKGAPVLMHEALGKVLKKQGISLSDVFVIPHQASAGVLSNLAKLGVVESQMANCLANHGNLSTSSVPVAYCATEDKSKNFENIALVAVGAGASYGSILLEAL